MKTKIDNAADEFATLQAVDLEPNTKYPALLAALAKLAPEDEDFEIIIRRIMLTDSYRYNPSMLARNAFIRLEGFADYVTYSIGETHVGIKFMREEKEARHHKIPEAGQSVRMRTLSWLDGDKEKPLDIPKADVPSSIWARPEQFAYTIRRETEQRIKLTKFKLFLRIALK